MDVFQNILLTLNLIWVIYIGSKWSNPTQQRIERLEAEVIEIHEALIKMKALETPAASANRH